jgi:hypothetical protein
MWSKHAKLLIYGLAIAWGLQCNYTSYIMPMDLQLFEKFVMPFYSNHFHCTQFCEESWIHKKKTSFKVFLWMLCPYNALLYFFIENQILYLKIQHVGHCHAFSNVLSLFDLWSSWFNYIIMLLRSTNNK